MGKKLLATGIGVGLAAALVGGTAAAKPELTSDVAYHATGGRSPFEDKLTQAVRTSFDMEAVVRCEEPGDLDGPKAPAASGPLRGTTMSSHQEVWFNPAAPTYIRIHPLACLALERAVEGGEPAAVELAPIGYAASIVAGEALDAKYDDVSEAQAACYGVQRAGMLLRNLGLGLQASQTIAETYAVDAAALYTPEGVQYPAGACLDETGIWDLDPNSPGYFPGGQSASRDLDPPR